MLQTTKKERQPPEKGFVVYKGEVYVPCKEQTAQSCSGCALFEAEIDCDEARPKPKCGLHAQIYRKVEDELYADMLRMSRSAKYGRRREKKKKRNNRR